MHVSIPGLLWWLSGKESPCQCRRHGFDPWVRKISWRRKWQPAPVFLPGKSHEWRSLVEYSSVLCVLSHCSRVLTPCDPKDFSPSAASVHVILQARVLEWVAMPSSRGSSQPRDPTLVS